MYYIGLRFGEAANLLWDSDNIDFTNNQINLSNRSPQKDIPVFSVKDYESRSISVPQKVMNMLKELKEKSEPGCPFVFLSPSDYQRLVERWHYDQQKVKPPFAEKRLRNKHGKSRHTSKHTKRPDGTFINRYNDGILR